MAASMSVAVEIRKLRKKLRQIENLERLNRPLDHFEEEKVSKKSDIREQLRLLLNIEENEAEPSDTAHTSESTLSFSPISADLSLEERVTVSYKEPVEKQELSKTKDLPEVMHLPGVEGDRTLMQETGKFSPELTKGKHSKQGQYSKYSESMKKMQMDWKKMRVKVTELDGHSDVITSVVADGFVLVSGSRDTTVKVWDLEKKVEVRSLGSHTETVTCVTLLSLDESSSFKDELSLETGDRLIISGSTDSSFKLWSLNTGHMLGSVYTFSPLTHLAYNYAAKCLVTASVGGKLELWDLKSKENISSVRAHDNSVTGLKVTDSYVFSSDAEGLVMVHTIRDQKLVCMFVSEDVKSSHGSGIITTRLIHSLEVALESIVYGDDAINIKVLDWKKGTVHKLPNHSKEFASTDAICFFDNLLISSSYDLDMGLGYINVRSYPAGDYLATFDDDRTKRILCLACSHLASSHLLVISGGMQLKVWETVPPGKSFADDSGENGCRLSGIKFIPRLAHPARDSEAESDFDDSDYDYNEDKGREEDTDDSEAEHSNCKSLAIVADVISMGGTGDLRIAFNCYLFRERYLAADVGSLRNVRQLHPPQLGLSPVHKKIQI